jgi:hypothetical protein
MLDAADLLDHRRADSSFAKLFPDDQQHIGCAAKSKANSDPPGEPSARHGHGLGTARADTMVKSELYNTP